MPPAPLPEELIELERSFRDGHAEEYDERSGRLAFELAVLDACYESLLDLRPGLTVLDAGCGTGRHLPFLLARAGKVIAFDHSERSLELARARVPPAEQSRLETVVGDIRSLPLEDGSVDRVLCSEVLSLVPTAEFRLQTVKEFARVLAVGGRAVVSAYRWLGHIRWRKEGRWETGLYYHAFTSGEFGRLVRRGGLVDVQVAGAAVLPSWARRAGVSVEKQRRLAFTPFGRHLAHFLVAAGSTPAADANRPG